MMIDNNQKTYNTQHIVQHYAQLNNLQPAEATVLALLHHHIATGTMLDIGVGGGRTTQHFAPAAADYVGIDYASTMIAACQQRFAANAKLRFAVGDARDLRQFNDRSFDFILFSFNGIDYVSHGDRLQILQEIHRVGKPGGYFCFSSHNLVSLEREFDIRSHLSFNPLTTYVNLVMFAILRGCNRSLHRDRLKTCHHAIVRDESHNFSLKTYYIRPTEQIAQLAANFQDIQVYSWQHGQEITAQSDGAATTDKWLYYLCRIK